MTFLDFVLIETVNQFYENLGMMTANIRKNAGLNIVAVLFLFLLPAWNAQAEAEGDLVVRGRIISVLPSKESIDPTNQLMPILNNTTAPEVDADYYLGQTISTELSLPVSRHNVKSNQDASNLGSVWVVSPSLTLKYHFFTDKIIKPYVGAGVNYSKFIATDSANGKSLSFSSSIAPVFQIGADLQINKVLSLNADIKKVYMRPSVGVSKGTDSKATIDPYILGFGVGYKF